MVPPPSSRSSSPLPSPLTSIDTAIKRTDSISDDDEFRRAQEMALAVAALGSSSKPVDPSNIRLAVELKYAAAKERKGKKARINKQEKEEERQRQILEKERRRQEQKKLEENDSILPIPESIRAVWIELLKSVEGQVLQGPNLIAALGIINCCILYLAVVPPSSSLLFRIVNAAFVVNMTVVMCLTKVDVEPSKDVVAEDDEDHSTSALSGDQESDDDKQQEQLLEQIKPLPIPKSQTRMEWLNGINFSQSDLEMLESLQPESTLAERRRFLKARKFCVKAASAQLGSYLQWRETNRIDEFFPTTFTTDEDDWTLAARGAVEIGNTSGQPASVSQMKLPRIVSAFENDDERQTNVVCKNGARIVHVLPCQLDSNLAAPPTYALAVAMYLDRKLDRDFTEKVTVVIDIRFGQGWTNPSSVSIVPFIKLVVGLLNSYFPERLSRCILFPLPMTATMLFNTAKTYLDPDTAAKIQVCSGTGSVSAPVPDKVLSFIDRKAINAMEERRMSFFR